MTGSKQLIVALVVVLTIIVIVRTLKQRRNRRENYRIGSPAEPRQKQMADELKANLATITTFGKNFEQQAAKLNDAEKALVSEKKLIVPVPIVKAITDSMVGAERALGSLPPTYANYQQVYIALTGDAENMRETAKLLITAGRNIHQQIGFTQAEGASMNTLGEAGDSLIAMGTNIRCLPASVHKLGYALDLE